MQDDKCVQRLSEVLCAIEQSPIPVSRRKVLEYKAIQMVLGAPGITVEGQLEMHEETPHHFRSLPDGPCNTAEAVQWVRDRGDPKLANRLRAAVRRRNAAAHPDTKLSHDIAEFIVKEPSRSTSSGPSLAGGGCSSTPSTPSCAGGGGSGRDSSGADGSGSADGDGCERT